MEESDGHKWYFSEIKDRKLPARFLETSIIDPRLHHEVTFVVIGWYPNTPWKRHASLQQKTQDNNCGGIQENKGKALKEIKENKNKLKNKGSNSQLKTRPT